MYIYIYIYIYIKHVYIYIYIKHVYVPVQSIDCLHGGDLCHVGTKKLICEVNQWAASSVFTRRSFRIAYDTSFV